MIASFLISLTGTFFPSQSDTQTILFKLDALFAISAFACLGAKATTEHYDIPAAGFNVLAISQGLFLAEIDKPRQWNYESATTAVLFMIPSFIMISYYTKFPKWLRIGGIISVLPFIIMILLRYEVLYENTLIAENIIYLIYQVITLCWAWQVWKEN